MTHRKHFWLWSGFLFALTVVASPAHAQSLRTFVSAGGDDGNPCSRTSPCQTFSHASTKMLTGSEINMVDATGFGTLTVGQSINIINDSASIAGITATGGADGIDINDSNIVINLRALAIEGANQSVSGD